MRYGLKNTDEKGLCLHGRDYLLEVPHELGFEWRLALAVRVVRARPCAGEHPDSSPHGLREVLQGLARHDLCKEVR